MRWFSKIYNNYDDEIKVKLLVNEHNKYKQIDEVSLIRNNW